mmetsp:Transcript_7517/g.25109  ORF Transcript_7517/g.25109 Transcript_7517/m.25109 type:complete len:279 (-) Transcript_7517:262-1098(-)
MTRHAQVTTMATPAKSLSLPRVVAAAVRRSRANRASRVSWNNDLNTCSIATISCSIAASFICSISTRLLSHDLFPKRFPGETGSQLFRFPKIDLEESSRVLAFVIPLPAASPPPTSPHKSLISLRISASRFRRPTAVSVACRSRLVRAFFSRSPIGFEKKLNTSYGTATAPNPLNAANMETPTTPTRNTALVIPNFENIPSRSSPPPPTLWNPVSNTACVASAAHAALFCRTRHPTANVKNRWRWTYGRTKISSTSTALRLNRQCARRKLSSTKPKIS